MASAVFLNYRREDCEATVAHLYDCLRGWFGDTVYFDRHSVSPGADFPDELKDAVVGCKAMIAVIGPEWFSDVNRERLMKDPKDWVRQEIELALRTHKLVIPLLVEVGVANPFLGMKLPLGMVSLTSKNWVRIDHPSMPGDAFDKIRAELESKGIEPVPRPAAVESARRQVEALLAQPKWLVQWLENRKLPEILANAHVICRENVARLEQLMSGPGHGQRDAALLAAAERLKAVSQEFARELGVLGGSAYVQASSEFGSLRFLVSRRSELWADKQIHTGRMARFHPGLTITPVEVHPGDGGAVRVKRVSIHKPVMIPQLGVGMGSFAAATAGAAIGFLATCPVPIAVLHEIGADLLEPVREFLTSSSHKLVLVALGDSRRCHVLGSRGQDLWFQDNLAGEVPVMVFCCPWGRVVVGLGVSHNHDELLRLVEPQILLMPIQRRGHSARGGGGQTPVLVGHRDVRRQLPGSVFSCGSGGRFGSRCQSWWTAPLAFRTTLDMLEETCPPKNILKSI